MSQPITNLSEGAFIKLQETVGGAVSRVGFKYVASPDNNPFGNDRCLFKREYALAPGDIYSPDAQLFYGNSGIDNNLSNSYASRFAQEILSVIPTTTIKCYSLSEAQFYTIPRKFFLLSSNEYGGGAIPQDDTSVVPYFTTITNRYTPAQGESTVRNATRTPYTSNNIYGVVSNGSVTSNSTFNTRTYVPCFNILATALVSDEPDEDGYYALIPDPDNPYLYVRFHCSLGTVADMPLKVRVDLTTEGNPEITSLQVCNNYGDASPTWENMTVGEKHTFVNTTKTADNWEIGVKVEARGENAIRVYEPFAIIQTEVD